LVSRRPLRLADLAGRRVGVGGIPTTGWLLLRRLCPEAITVEMPYEKIGEAVLGGELDAGVMIHEELLYYPKLGLRRVADLGAEWCHEHSLPLPVGLNLVRRDIAEDDRERLCAAIRRSLMYARRHRKAGLAWVSRFGRGVQGACTDRFVEMFANEDSLSLPADVRRALPILFAEAVALGQGDTVPALDVVEGAPAGCAAG
jgi:1,4-dihydroxy-6-naphthoate synthase